MREDTDPLANLNTVVTSLADKVTNLETSTDELLTQKLTSVVTGTDQKLEEMSQLQEKIKALEETIEERNTHHDEAIQSKEELLATASKQIQDLDSEYLKLKVQEEQAQALIAALKEAAKEASKQRHVATSQLARETGKERRQEEDTALSAAVKAMEDAKQEKTEIQMQLETAKNDISTLNAQIESQKRRGFLNNNDSPALEEMKTKLKGETESLQEIQRKVEGLIQKIDAFNGANQQSA